MDEIRGYELTRPSARVVRFHTRAVTGTAERPDIVEIRFASVEGGRPVAVSIKAARGLRAADIRRLPWSTWIAFADDAVRHGDLLAKFGGFGDGSEEQPLDFAELPEVTAEFVARKNRRPKRPGRRGHGDDHYEQVAQLYLGFAARGLRNPTARIAEQMNVTRSTAAGWVRGARTRGYLPPARPGRAG